MKTGNYTRKQVIEIIQQSRVTVNNKIVNSENFFVKEKSIIKVDNKEITLSKETIYIMLNKPKGYTCQKTIKEKNVFPIGRLDKETEGLILLTNNGDYTNKILSPNTKIEKEYSATLEKDISNEEIKIIESGVMISVEKKEYKTQNCKIELAGPKKINIIIKEGKKRQIRKMLEAINNKVLELKRIRIGSLKIENLKLGEYKYLTKEEAELALKN